MSKTKNLLVCKSFQSKKSMKQHTVTTSSAAVQWTVCTLWPQRCQPKQDIREL